MLARIPGRGMESCVGEDDHDVVKLGNQGLRVRVVDIGGGIIPGIDRALLIQDKTQLAVNNPPLIALPFLANLRGAPPSCIGWMNSMP